MVPFMATPAIKPMRRSEEHTSELQSHSDLVCRLLLEKKEISGMVSIKTPSDDPGEKLHHRAGSVDPHKVPESLKPCVYTAFLGACACPQSRPADPGCR